MAAAAKASGGLGKGAMIDAAIIGLGWGGRKMADSVQGRSKRLRFVRGVTKEPDDARDLAAAHGLELSTEFADAVADPAVAALVLCTPHSLHAAQVQAAAAAGKHVFCEQPLALTKADAEAAIAACEAAGVVLGLGMNRRFWPSMTAIRAMVAAGEMGEIMHIEGNYSHDILAHTPPDNWRRSPDEAPAGGMTAMGIHLLDAYVDLLGPVAEVQVLCVDRVLGQAAGDTVSVLLRFQSGATGYLCTILKTAFVWRLQLFGADAWVEMRDETSITVRRGEGDPEQQSFAPADSLLAEIDAFAAAITGGAPFPIPASEMIHVIAVMDAIFESARGGAVVMVA